MTKPTFILYAGQGKAPMQKDKNKKPPKGK